MSVGFKTLLIIFNSASLAATALTYANCVSDTTSYQVGGWCFQFFASPQAPAQSSITNAQAYCGPYGSLAVGVTYKMVQMISTKVLQGRSTNNVFLAAMRNMSYAPLKQGWYWKPLLPDGTYAYQPIIFSNLPWSAGEPNNYYPPEDGMNVLVNTGVMDIQSWYALDQYGRSAGYICQFVPLQWNYIPRGTGKFIPTIFLVRNSTDIHAGCILQCHKSVYCISLAFSSSTNNCQLYAVSPEDPRFAANVTADSNYQFYIRDGMEY